jgi:hypothetical protein
MKARARQLALRDNIAPLGPIHFLRRATIEFARATTPFSPRKRQFWFPAGFFMFLQIFVAYYGSSVLFMIQTFLQTYKIVCQVEKFTTKKFV